MAGNGPAPAAVRRRRNEPARGEWIDLPPLEKGEKFLPDLPDLSGFVDPVEGKPVPWLPRSRETWKAWQADPVTRLYSPADIDFALETIGLKNYGEKPNEIRLRMDTLGLTPKGKKDLRWRIAAEAVLVPDRPKAKGKKATADRRRRLELVKN